MKRTVLTSLCIVIVLSALCTGVPAARADETEDYVDQIYRDQQQLDEYLGKVDETQRYGTESTRISGSAMSIRRTFGRTQPQVPVAGPVALPQAIPFMFPAQAAAQLFQMPLNPRQAFAFQQMQGRQIMQMQQMQRMQQLQMMRFHR